MKSETKSILLQPSTNKQSEKLYTTYHALWLLSVLSFFVIAFMIVTITLKNSGTASTKNSDHSGSGTTAGKSPLPGPIFDALLHYASFNSTSSKSRMSPEELSSVAAVLRACNASPAPCNFLVFGLTHELFLWNTLNFNGRTVFVGDNDYIISKLEERHPEIEAYDVDYTTKVSEMYELLDYIEKQVKNECRPVQHLLFSDCKLAINDLPNYAYDVNWDVILIDGPLGNSANAPGRISAIFTAGVLGRSKKGGGDKTHVFVHEIGREMEKVSSEEFLCEENLVEKVDSLGHFVIGKMEADSVGYCSNSSSSLPSSTSPSSASNERMVNRRTVGL